MCQKCLHEVLPDRVSENYVIQYMYTYYNVKFLPKSD